MKIKFPVFIALALLFTLYTPAYAEDNVIPPVPQAFYGNITVNGAPAPVGTKVEARGEEVHTGVVGNPILTTIAGKYGYGGSDPEFNQKLIVQGNIAPNALIRFYVNEVDTGERSSFHSGDITNLNLSVTTSSLSITASSATSITSTSATLRGNLISLGTASSMTVSFQWGTTTNYGNETTTQTRTAIGSFSATISGLTANTTYHYRVKAVSGDETEYSDDSSFTTTAVQVAGQTSLIGKISSQGIMTETVTAKSADSYCRLKLQSGVKALDKQGNPLSQISISPISQPQAPPDKKTIIGLAYNFTPDGATFNPPVTLEFTYNSSKVLAGTEAELVIAYYDSSTGKWIELESKVNTTTKVITASISHFTAFTVLGRAPATATSPAALPTASPTPSGPANFNFSSLTISPKEAKIGETITISISITNTGAQSGTLEVKLKIGDNVEAIQKVTVPGGATNKVSFTTAKDKAGTYSVDIAGLTGSFTVGTTIVASASKLSLWDKIGTKFSSLTQKITSLPLTKKIIAKLPFSLPVLGIIVGVIIFSVLLTYFLTKRRYYY